MASEEELLLNLNHPFFDLCSCFALLDEKLAKLEGEIGALQPVMYCGGGQWSCGRAGTVGLQRVSSIVREIGEPCLHQSSIKISKTLNPDKWQANFDSDGKLIGFHKALKLIVLGGVDPSIRPEVWEYLLGCYTLSSTAEYRRQLRTARRARYEDLVRQCQMMHSSIGTGSLAYVVGSKVMDARTLSKDEKISEAKHEIRSSSVDNDSEVGTFYDCNDNCTGTNISRKMESFNDSADLVSVRESVESAARDSSCFVTPIAAHNRSSSGREASGSQDITGSYTSFPSLPAVNLCEKSGEDKSGFRVHDADIALSKQPDLSFEDDKMHSFQINNNTDLVMESNGSPCDKGSLPVNTEIEMVQSDARESVSKSKKLGSGKEIVNRLRISDVPDTTSLKATTSQEGAVNDDKVSEWLWTLHRIVVDVVRTDNHLEFYEDTRNLARMSDILAVYAWVDPATGYCQGMSDLLSPFVVLFEDNADAFWCFEMLIRRMRENFRMEGPTGVMKQLETLWDILKLTDREMFTHLSHIGAESLHFAFRMLLVLFRRELSFDEALCMWEMMWAADFSEKMAFHLENNCLEALAVQLPQDSIAEIEENTEHGHGISERSMHPNEANVGRPMLETKSTHHFCGLTRKFWSRSDRMQMCTAASSARSRNDELPVFCVAAILILNRHKIIRGTHSFEDLIKTFNDNMLKIDVKRCISSAIKLRKRYFYKLIRTKNNPPAHQNDE